MLTPERYHADYYREMNQFRRTGRGPTIGRTIDMVGRHQDGTEFPIELSLEEMNLDGEWTTMGVVRDVRDRREAEQKLQESEQLLQRILNTSPNVVFIFDLLTKNYLYASSEISRILGYSPDDLQQMGTEMMSRLLHPDDVDRVLQYHEKVAHLADGQVAEVEYRMLHRDGDWRWLFSRATPFVRDDSGRGIQSLGITIDITGRRQEQEQLALFKRFVDASAQGFGIATLTGHIYYVNQTLGRMLGVNEPDAARGKLIAEFYPPALQDKLRREILPAVLRGENWTGEMTLIAQDGRLTPTLESYFLICDPAGQPLYLADVLSDMSERKEAEETLARSRDELEMRVLARTAELQESEAKYREVIERAHDGVVIIQDGKFVFANQRLAQMSGYSVDEIVGMPFLQVIQPEMHELMRERIHRRFAGKDAPATYEISLVGKSGDLFHIEVNAGVIQYLGQPADLVLMRDIGERMNARRELAQRMEELERFNRLAVGRELQMIELKREVNRLSAAQGEPPPYDLDFVDADLSSPSRTDQAN